MAKWLLFIILFVPNPVLGKGKSTRKNDFKLPHQTKNNTISFSLGTGYRRDYLDWNIASDLYGNTTPNILSELTWRNIESRTIKGTFYVPFETKWGDFVLDAGVTYAYSFDGENQDSDWNQNNRTDEWSRSINQTDGTYFTDYEVNLSYKILKRTPIDIYFIIGFGYYMQFFKMKDLYQVISGTNTTGGGQPPSIGTTNTNLNSSYHSEWNGLALGLSLNLKPTEKQTLKITGKYFPILEYYGKGDWNLRNLTFNHGYANNINGFNIHAKYELTFNRIISIYKRDGHKKLKTKVICVYTCIDYKKFKTSTGLDVAHLSDGTTSTQRLNEVSWNSFYLTIGIDFKL